MRYSLTPSTAPLRESFPGIGDDLVTKVDALEARIRAFPNAALAFSGGVDSTFLAWVSARVLGTDGVLLVTSISETYPQFERDDAAKLSTHLGLRQVVIHTEELGIPGFKHNPSDRCYHCKKELFSKIKVLAGQQGFGFVFEGGIADDLGDFRPGRKAIAELGIASPLCDAGITKDEIRRMSALVSLPTATKPSFACLASRFPYGEEITLSKLTRVESAEAAIRALGFTQFRVRSHGDAARIELAAEEMDRGWQKRSELDAACRQGGFVYVSLDLRGYRTGAMNEAIGKGRSQS